MLSDESLLESRRGEYESMPEIEAMLDRGFQPVKVRERFLQLAIGLAQLLIDLLEAWNVGMFVW
jgi:hypothetical protein